MARISRAGLDLIKRFEGLALAAYQDATGVWTIGYGHTGPDVYRGRRITPEEAERLLLEDVRAAEQCVENGITRDATQDQFDAMVSFAYNIGCRAFKRSTLLRLFNEGKAEEAAREFERWVYAGGRRLRGLERRRAAEAALFRGEA